MKKALAVLVLLFLLTACIQWEFPRMGGSLPYRVWGSWEEMKEVLGDHYLYPTYLPEVALRNKEDAFKRSWYNYVPRDSESGELFSEYTVSFSDGWPNDSITISAFDGGRRVINPMFNNTHPLPPYPHTPIASFDSSIPDYRFNEHTVTIGGIDIEFVSLYAIVHPPEYWIYDPDEWYKYHSGNRRVVVYEFKIDTVTYRMLWTQNNVEDKYADDEQREGMLRVAKSIIEQVREIEQDEKILGRKE